MTMMIALILSTNYVMFGLPNVKLMDMLVFLSGFWLGPLYGAATGALSWMVYGTMNPLGFSILTFVTVIPMEMVYGLLGGFLGKKAPRSTSSLAWSFAVVGLLSTLLYDLVTNAVTGVIYYENVLVGILTGIPLSITHIASNLLQFAVLAPLVVTQADKLFLWRLNHIDK